MPTDTNTVNPPVWKEVAGGLTDFIQLTIEFVDGTQDAMLRLTEGEEDGTLDTAEFRTIVATVGVNTLLMQAATKAIIELILGESVADALAAKGADEEWC